MSVNKAILVGNLGKDPELRYTPSGTAVCTFSLATTDRFKNKQGEQQERTEWHNIVMYDRLAEIAAECDGRSRIRRGRSGQFRQQRLETVAPNKGLRHAAALLSSRRKPAP